MNFTIGCDPEIFFKDSKDKLISVIDLLGGNKGNPVEFQPGFHVLEDNVAAEFNVPPSLTKEEWNNNVLLAMNYLQQVANTKGLGLSKVASGCFDLDQLDHPMAFVFGCEPDFNAWTGRKNSKPNSSDISLRSCGGHIHLGFPYSSKEEQRAVIKVMDLFIGVPSICMDTDTRRRELYGKAGAFRYKSYGAEYRTPSNFWIWEESTRSWVYNQVEKGMQFLEKNGIDFLDKEEEAITTCINYSDKDAYNYLVNKYKEIL